MFGRSKKSTLLDMDGFDSHSRDHTLIASSVHVVGDIKFAGTLRIDGRVDGKIGVQSGKTGTLVVSKDATVNGPISATEVVVDGNVNGNMKVDGRVECRPHAIIRGELHYGSLHISEGAMIEGRCMQNTKTPDMPRLSKAKARTQAISGNTEAPAEVVEQAAAPEKIITFLSKDA